MKIKLQTIQDSQPSQTITILAIIIFLKRIILLTEKRSGLKFT